MKKEKEDWNEYFEFIKKSHFGQIFCDFDGFGDGNHEKV